MRIDGKNIYNHLVPSVLAAVTLVAGAVALRDVVDGVGHPAPLDVGPCYTGIIGRSSTVEGTIDNVLIEQAGIADLGTINNIPLTAEKIKGELVAQHLKIGRYASVMGQDQFSICVVPADNSIIENPDQPVIPADF